MILKRRIVSSISALISSSRSRYSDFPNIDSHSQDSDKDTTATAAPISPSSSLLPGARQHPHSMDLPRSVTLRAVYTGLKFTARHHASYPSHCRPQHCLPAAIQHWH